MGSRRDWTKRLLRKILQNSQERAEKYSLFFMKLKTFENISFQGDQKGTLRKNG